MNFVFSVDGYAQHSRVPSTARDTIDHSDEKNRPIARGPRKSNHYLITQRLRSTNDEQWSARMGALCVFETEIEFARVAPDDDYERGTIKGGWFKNTVKSDKVIM